MKDLNHILSNSENKSQEDFMQKLIEHQKKDLETFAKEKCKVSLKSSLIDFTDYKNESNFMERRTAIQGKRKGRNELKSCPKETMLMQDYLITLCS